MWLEQNRALLDRALFSSPKGYESHENIDIRISLSMKIRIFILRRGWLNVDDH